MPEATGYGISKIVLCDEAGVPYDLSGGGTSGASIVADAPNGVDDTIGLNNAAAAAAASGAPFAGAVALRSGLYKTATGFASPTGVRITGAGKNATVIRKTANCDLLSYAGSSNAVRNQRGGLADVRLDGGGFTGSLIYTKWADHLNFDRVFCFNNSDMALYTENLWDTYFNEVEFDTCSGINGLGPGVQITSNADDSSNIIVFTNCRWENQKDGFVVISSRKMTSAYTTATGTNPPYGIYFKNCKFETPQLRGIGFDASADVSDVHFQGGYVAVRGLYSGIVTGRTIFNLIGAYDFSVEDMKILINGVTNPTCSDLFRVFTSGGKHVIRNNQIDVQQNPSGALLNVAGGVPDLCYEDNVPRLGQTPTLVAGAWLPTIASATTTTLLHLPRLINISGTTTITSITAQTPGRVVTLKFTGILTLTDGSNLKLAGNLVTAADTTITLMCDGTNWIEMSRSAN